MRGCLQYNYRQIIIIIIKKRIRELWVGTFEEAQYGLEREKKIQYSS